ncbi:hypothetical protein MUK42_33378 [Musa troglodytarum]|uniref:Uncharacterized protein n=1 Tax=Musa troglodytarum TaxID=320322 RepID=A0A9E7EYL4_9LILI|nr:hypothetical protein MUK42_33378 [Musa troglodytarum]
MSLYCSSGRFNASKMLERRGTTRSYLHGTPSVETSGSLSCACSPKLCRTSPTSTSSRGTPSPSTKASCRRSSIACDRIGTRNLELCDQMGVKACRGMRPGNVVACRSRSSPSRELLRANDLPRSGRMRSRS